MKWSGWFTRRRSKNLKIDLFATEPDASLASPGKTLHDLTPDEFVKHLTRLPDGGIPPGSLSGSLGSIEHSPSNKKRETEPFHPDESQTRPMNSVSDNTRSKALEVSQFQKTKAEAQPSPEPSNAPAKSSAHISTAAARNPNLMDKQKTANVRGKTKQVKSTRGPQLSNKKRLRAHRPMLVSESVQSSVQAMKRAEAEADMLVGELLASLAEPPKARF